MRMLGILGLTPASSDNSALDSVPLLVDWSFLSCVASVN
jgi:hypothetical protein